MRNDEDLFAQAMFALLAFAAILLAVLYGALR